jgi:hypothetical protein
MIFVEVTPNTGPPIKEIFAFVSRDASGQENVIGGTVPGLGMIQLMTGNPKTFETFKRLVAEARPGLEAGGQTIHLLHFSNREEILKW